MQEYHVMDGQYWLALMVLFAGSECSFFVRIAVKTSKNLILVQVVDDFVY